MQNNTAHNTATGFSDRSQRILFAVIVILGLMIVAGIGTMIYMGFNRYVHGSKPAATKSFEDPSNKKADESTFGSVLMVPRQGLEVVHSAVGMPDGKLAVVMFPGFSSSSSGKEPVKKDANNTADGGRILVWDPTTGHITQEMRITSVQPQIQSPQ